MNKIDKMIGNIIGKPRVRGGKNDWDGDGVLNRKDCQPRNTMRQDDRQEFLAARENYQKNKTPENFKRMKETMKNFNPFEESLALR